MKTKLLKSSFIAGVATLAASSASAIVELDVTSVISQIGAPGDPFVAPSVGQLARYNINLFDTESSASRAATLQVELVSFDSGLTSHSISTGQGGNSSRVGISLFGGSTNRAAVYQFSFFNTTAFTNPLPISNSVMQVSDIDQAETVSVRTFAFSGATLNNPTDLQITTPDPFITAKNTIGENSDKNDPKAAANFNSIANVTTFQLGFI